MRLTPSPYRRTLASAALLVAAAACADLATQPDKSASRGLRLSLADSTGVADTTTAASGTTATATTASDTTAVATTPTTADTSATTPSAVDTTVVIPDSAPAPQLLVCPTTDEQSASAVIGPEGGSVTARGATITIPAGAVPEPTLFEVVVPASQYMEADIRAVGSEHYVFQSPVTITINYARCPAGAIPAGAKLQGVYVDTGTYQVLQQMGGVNYKWTHKVSFTTPHLSGYIIAY